MTQQKLKQCRYIFIILWGDLMQVCSVEILCCSNTWVALWHLCVLLVWQIAGFKNGHSLVFIGNNNIFKPIWQKNSDTAVLQTLRIYQVCMLWWFQCTEWRMKYRMLHVVWLLSCLCWCKTLDVTLFLMWPEVLGSFCTVERSSTV